MTKPMTDARLEEIRWGLKYDDCESEPNGCWHCLGKELLTEVDRLRVKDPVGAKGEKPMESTRMTPTTSETLLNILCVIFDVTSRPDVKLERIRDMVKKN